MNKNWKRFLKRLGVKIHLIKRSIDTIDDMGKDHEARRDEYRSDG